MTVEDQYRRVAALGFTPRQTAFLLLVLRHSGVCVARQYCAHAGIVRGQKSHDFFGRLVVRGLATPYACAHGQAKVYHVHHKALYRAIGEPNTRFRRPTSIPKAVERLMVLDYLVERPKTHWLASGREKVEHFCHATRAPLDALPVLVFRGATGCETARYFPDRLPIGLAETEESYTFLFLAVQDVPLDFRAFMHRHAELLRHLRRWQIAILLPRHLAKAMGTYQEAFREELTQPLRPDVADEVRWYFGELRRDAPRRGPRFLAAQRDFRGVRFRGLYRAWREFGDRVVYGAMSPITADAVSRGEGRLECQIVPHQYLHLAPLVGTA